MTVKQLMFPAHRAFNSDGAPELRATASLYVTGTSTPALFYEDIGLTVSLGSVITANSAGRFNPVPYQNSTTAFRLIVKDAGGAVLDDIDPFYFGLAAGVDGSTATVAVGTVATGAAGSSAIISNSGTGVNAVLDFSIPTGAQGPAGDVAKATDRTALAAIAGATAGMIRHLVGEGPFTFKTAAQIVGMVGIIGFSATALVTADPLQGVYVAPASDTTGASGAWVRQESRLGPHHFGAKGDGVANDVPAWQAAFNFTALVGWKLYPIDGVYMMSSAASGTYKAVLKVPTGGNLNIEGSGKNCVLKTPDGFTAAGDYNIIAPIDATATNNVHIRGLAFDGNVANNLVIDSTTNIRGAYAIWLDNGQNINVEKNFFYDQPGRNVVALRRKVGIAGDYPISKARIASNNFKNVGGTIAGNENQNDHSTVYVDGKDYEIVDNFFWNENEAFDPFAAPAHACNPIECHGKDWIAHRNFIYNFGGIAAIAAVYGNMTGGQFVDNVCLNIKANGFIPFTLNAYGIDGLTIARNYIEQGNAATAGGTLYYNYTAGGASWTKPVSNLKFNDNTLIGLNTAPAATFPPFMQITGLNGGEIRRNTFKYCQGAAIQVTNADTLLGVKNLDIDDNRFIDCGISSSNSRPDVIWIENVDATGVDVIDGVRIGHGNRIIKSVPAVGAAVVNGRGIRLTGSGKLGVRIEVPSFVDINRTQQIENLNTHPDQSGIVIVPRVSASATAATPTQGFFTPGQNVIYHTDPVAGGSVGKVPVVGGCAFNSTWAATTQYVPGQWVSFGSNKYGKCVVGGVSGTVAPAPVTIGQTIADGTVTWFYVDTAAATFQTFGKIQTYSPFQAKVAFDPPSMASGTTQGTTLAIITANGIAAGDGVLTSFDLDPQGIITFGNWYSANLLFARFYNQTGGTIDLAAGNLRWRKLYNEEIKAKASAVWDAPSVATGAQTSTIIPVACNFNDFVYWGTTGDTRLAIISAYVSAANAVTINEINLQGSATDLASATYTVYVVREEVLSFIGSTVVDPASIANGSGLSITVPVPGAALGDFALAAFGLDLQGLSHTVQISAANTATVRLHNATGGAVDLASLQIRVGVIQKLS